MGVLDRFLPMATRQLAASPVRPQVEAWTNRDHLDGVIFHDITGVWPSLVGRDGAMRVPAVARARHLTCGAIAPLPLRTYNAETPVERQQYWLQGTDGQLGDLDETQRERYGLWAPQSPWERMLWTVDDHLFYGLSLWLATRLDPEDNRPQRMVHIPYDRWGVDEDEQRIVDYDGQPFPRDSVFLIPGPHSGILDFGADTIGTAATLERTTADYARRPFRLELHQTTESTLDLTERKELIDQVRTALADNNGVLYTNAAIETIEHRLDASDMLVTARNASALDIARHVGMPAAMLDATTEGASLEYATLTGRNQQWLDYGLSIYMDAITARLGMDDVVPAGQRVAFDTTDLTDPVASPTGPATED